jgi:branched-chain amino acid transport system substrate-binding protein
MKNSTTSHGRGLWSLAGVLAVLLTACGGSSGTNTGSGGSTGPDIIIGEALAATGADAKEGGLTKQGVDMWLDWINNKQGGIKVGGVKHKVQVIFKDDGSKPDQSAALDQQLITESKAQFLLGPYGSSATATAAVIAEKNQIPMVEGEGASTSIFSKGYKYVFGTISPAGDYLKSVIDMAADLNPKPTKIAMLAADDAFSQDVAKAVAQYAPTKGLQVAFNQSYPNGSTNLSGLVSQAKAVNPDILMNSGHLQEAIAISKAAKQLDLQAKMYAYTVGPSTPDFVSALGPDANFVVSPSQWTPSVKSKPSFFYTNDEYVSTYEKMFNSTDAPDYHVAGGTSACLALEKAIENAGSLDPQKVRDALAKLNIETFFGTIAFNSQGYNDKKPMVVEQIQNGKHVTIYPANIAPGKLAYPAPPWSQR